MGLILLCVNTVLYGLNMTKRLNKLQWLEHGLRTLASTGPNALRAELLAKSLGVTRGSFYWHFSNLQDFHRELLNLWKIRTTDTVIDEIENATEGPGRLHSLLTRSFASTQTLERAIRSWAFDSKDAAKTIASVDDLRLSYIADILKSSAIDEADQKLRANMLYWAYVGRVVMDNASDKWSDKDTEKLAQLFLS